MIFVLAEIIIQQKFKNQVSMQLFDIFCIESIKKSKKLGAAWTPRAYAIGKNENQQISLNGLVWDAVVI